MRPRVRGDSMLRVVERQPGADAIRLLPGGEDLGVEDAGHDAVAVQATPEGADYLLVGHDSGGKFWSAHPPHL